MYIYSTKHVPLVRDVDPLASRMVFSVAESSPTSTAKSDNGYQRQGLDCNGNERLECVDVDDSWVEVRLPLSTDPVLEAAWSDQDDSEQNWSRIRFAKFYSLMDALTGDVAVRHGTAHARKSRPDSEDVIANLDDFTVVTASHYNSTKLFPTDPTEDLILRSYAVDVGRSSIQIRTDVIQSERLIHFLHTVMVAVDRNTLLPRTNLPPLCLDSDLDLHVRERNLIAQEHKREIKQNKAIELTKLPPRAEETELVHALLLNQDPGNGNGAFELTRDWSFQSFNMVYPEQRNCNGKMFGGWVSSEAYDLAYLTARAFTGRTPIPLGADEMLFHLPVSVGNLLRFTSQVVYTTDKTIRVWVTVDLFDPRNPEHVERGKGGTKTNHLKFIFRQPENGHPFQIKPDTYEEILNYLGAKRFADYKGF